jgi:lysyl-tRNA synthetase class 2
METREFNEQEQNRRDAVEKLRELGIEPYPAELFDVNTTTTESAIMVAIEKIR